MTHEIDTWTKHGRNALKAIKHSRWYALDEGGGMALGALAKSFNELRVEEAEETLRPFWGKGSRNLTKIFKVHSAAPLVGKVIDRAQKSRTSGLTPCCRAAKTPRRKLALRVSAPSSWPPSCKLA